MVTRTRLPWLLLSLAGSAGAALWLLLPAIPQDPAYHRFADQRTLLGIDHFGNVASNLAFILVGLLGLQRGAPAGTHAAAWRLFYLGMLLVGIGSGWYHLAPDNDRLLWDRLAMALAFTALVTLLLADRLGSAQGDRWLWPLLAGGLGSVLYWYLTELTGAGDLRPYLLTQFLPLLLLPPLLLSPPGRLHSGPLWGMLALYPLAKAAELYDADILALTGWLSGHSLKHLLAAAAALGPLAAARLSRPGRW